MSLINQTRESRQPRKVRSTKEIVDFSRVGGLNHHLKTLRETIIFPLLHGNVFTHFKIKPARGILFYGPPGTGKTLLAGALVSELNKEGIGKVAFYHRKGADVLEKWVGESEKNLRLLFEKASKSKPSVIFFDELDGLAPIRTEKNDHIHSSVVATLLSLMDGLDSKPGVIVIGATNRIEAIDPALRRKGRFDKELYFPLPGVEARKEILQVITNNWKYKPGNEFIKRLSEATAGYSGSDLQALCSESVVACLKRLHPRINTRGYHTEIDAETLKVDECDFWEAKVNIVPTSMNGVKIRALSHVVKPLLEKQRDKVLDYINLLWPHFLSESYKFVVGEQRYAGKVLIIGSNSQGVNTHLIPSVLKNLEHLPTYFYDAGVRESIPGRFPAVLVLSKVDDMWDNIDENEQLNLVTSLEELHADLPVLIIASCSSRIPMKLHNFFYNSNTVMVKIDDPGDEEREVFLAPLFLDESNSLCDVLKRSKKESCVNLRRRNRKRNDLEYRGTQDKAICKRKREDSFFTQSKRIKTESDFSLNQTTSDNSLIIIEQGLKHNLNASNSSTESIHTRQNFTAILSDLLNERSFDIDDDIKVEPILDARQSYREKICCLWKHAALVTSKNMDVTQLELLYDIISACIGIYQDSIDDLLEKLENILRKIENSYKIIDYK